VAADWSFAHRQLKVKLPTGPTLQHAAAYLRTQRTAAKPASEAHRAEAAQLRRDQALHEHRLRAAKRQIAEADVAAKRAQAEADQRSGERQKQEKRTRRKGRVLELGGWGKRELARNATRARKAAAKEQHQYRQSLSRQYSAKQAALAAKRAARVAAAESARAAQRAVGVEALQRQERRVRDAVGLEAALAQTTNGRLHLAWVQQLSRAARQAWGVPSMSLHVICDASRPSTAPLQRLLASLAAADYLEDEVSARKTR
jgi:hypothetical protein